MRSFPEVPRELRLAVMDRAMVQVLQQRLSERLTAIGGRSVETCVVDRRKHGPHPCFDIEDRITQRCSRRAVEDVAPILAYPMIVLAGSDRGEMPLHIQDVQHETGEGRCFGARRPRDRIVREPCDQRRKIFVAIVCRAEHRADDRRKVARWHVLAHEHMFAART